MRVLDNQVITETCPTHVQVVARRWIYRAAAVSACALSWPIWAQSNFTADVIGGVMAGMPSGWPKPCLSLEKPARPEAIVRFNNEAEPALKAYLTLATKEADPSPAFKRSLPPPWALNGQATLKVADIRDPWAVRVARIEPITVILGGSELFGQGMWRAFDKDDHIIGSYTVEFVRKTKGYGIQRLALWSADRMSEARPVKPFCALVGDHEEWLAAKAKDEERRAARVAEKRSN